jgi:DNA-binding MarR family transcriptional regulator
MAKKDPAPPTPQRLSELLEHMFGLIYYRFAGDALCVMAESGLTMPQIVTMKILDHGGPQGIGFIGERLSLTPSTVSHLVDQLVKKGFVDRTEDPDDRRQKRLAITATGTTLLRRLTDSRVTEIARVLGSLDGDTRNAMAGAVERAIADLSRDLPAATQSAPASGPIPGAPKR